MNSPPPIVYVLVLVVGGGVAWYFWKQPSQSPGHSPASVSSSPSSTLGSGQNTSRQNTSNPSTATSASSSVVLDTSLADPTVVEIDGSVTMVKLVKLWQNEYAQQYPQRPTSYGVPDGKPNGSSRGLKGLVNGSLHMAASSRPLKPEEAKAGIQAIPVAKDAVAVVVGIDNPFKGGLTLKQLAGIYQGEITNWSEVGGPNARIRVLNRSPNSGTQELFKDKVLLGLDFASDGPYFYTFEQDVTTPILRALKTDGIGYTTVSQAENQLTVRIVSIDGVSPTDETAIIDGSYPINRNVFLAVPKQTSNAVKQFVDVALSEKGQSLVRQGGFIPIQ